MPLVKEVVIQSCSTLQPHGLYVARQAPLSMEFSRPEYWSGLPFPSPTLDLTNPGIKPRSPALQADSLPSESPGKPPYNIYIAFTFERYFQWISGHFVLS